MHINKVLSHIVGMFLVGHSVWGYILASLTARALRLDSAHNSYRFNPYIAMILAVIPDIDIMLYDLGIRHRSITHSILFWLVLFIPFLIVYRKRSLPYLVAVMQHIMVGDIIVGKTRVVWPLGYELGLGYSITSSVNITIEMIGIVIMLVLARSDGMLAVRRSNIFSIVIIIIVLGSLFYLLIPLPISKFRVSENIPYVVALHVVYSAVLSISFIQGVRSIPKT